MPTIATLLFLGLASQATSESDKAMYPHPTDAFGAMAHGRWDRARYLLDQLTDGKKKKVNIFYVQALCEWAQSSQYNANVLTGIRWCKEYGANFKEDDGYVLVTAINCDKWGEVVERLLQYGCDPNKPWVNRRNMNFSRTPLFASIGSGKSTKNMLTLLKFGASTEKYSEFILDIKGSRINITPLMYGAEQKDGVKLKLLISHKAKVNAICPEDGRTALHFAARWDCAENISLLLKAGAKKSLRNKAGETALDVAKKYKAKNAIAVLSK
ncbi:MAG: ankyrin repeat domain-containing protein [Armatimonadota bacterium]